MPAFEEAQERNTILFVGSYLEQQARSVKRISSLLEKKITPLVLLSVGDHQARKKLPADSKAVVITCDLSNELELEKVLAPFKHRLLAVTCRAEKNIPLLRAVIPHVPYLNTPTEKSLDWTTDKIKMRRLLRTYDRSISPKFLVVHDASDATLEKIETKVGYPMIVKPAGLAASLLVTLCYHREELEQTLAHTVRKIEAIYKKKQGRGTPQILVEQFMEGTMYSLDSYVNQRGVVYHTPLVHVKTGRSVGFEDFFGYMRITPVKLRPHKVEAAQKAAEKAIEALGLRSSTCHTELMKTEDGWKIIEVGPRIGGFRHEMYELSYGIDHTTNDILIRMPKKPKLSKKVRGYTVVMQFYAKKKGRLSKIEGMNRVRRLTSFQRIEIKKKPGEMCDFARNGDDPVFDIVLFNKDRSSLLADVRRLEQTVKIHIARPVARKTVVS